MKSIIFIFFILIPYYAFSQYKGGSYDGYSNSSIGKYGYPDSAQLARVWKGGSYDGYGFGFLGNWGQADSAQLANTWNGGSYDGYGFGFLGNWGQPDSAQLARTWKGGSYDGYGFGFLGSWGQADSAQLARTWKGGSYDGYGYNLWGFFNTTYIVKESWQHNKNSTNKAVVKLPTSVVCKLGTRNLFYGDAIGLFYSRNGELYCAGYGIWDFNDLNITVYSDDPLTAEKDGFDTDEQYVFLVWDGQKGSEYTAKAVYEFASSDKFTIGDTSIVDTLNVRLVKDHNIILNTGWNLVSTNVIPVKPDSMQHVISQISNNLVIVKNSKGDVCIPQYEINSIGIWDETQGYLIYMNNSDTLVITGTEIKPSETSIELKSGWNMISYLRTTSMNSMTAFSAITDNNNLLIAKDIKGAVYIPSFGINTLGDVKPGVGYRVYVTNNDTLIYPDN